MLNLHINLRNLFCWGALESGAAALKEQLTTSNQENQELQGRYNKVKQNRDQLHDQNRNLKKRISEFELERIRLVDQEDKLLHQIEQWEQEHVTNLVLIIHFDKFYKYIK